MNLEAHLLHEEGYRRSAYQDHLGYWTIGIGRLIDARKDAGLTIEEAKYLLANDIAAKRRELDLQLPMWRGLSSTRRMALLSMAFQMGTAGLLGFPSMLAALAARDYEGAAREALDSRWAQQTPERAHRVAAMLRDETIPAY